MGELLPSHPRHEVEAAGVRTSYYVAGSPQAPPLLLLHGMSASADSFRELMHDLAGDFYLLAPDIPGFGESGDLEPYTKPALLRWLLGFHDALGLEKTTLLGHSFGGALALAWAAVQPERTRGLVLLAPSLLAAERFPAWLRRLGELPLARRLLNAGTMLSRLNLKRQSRKPFHDPGRFDDSLWERRADDYRHARASGRVLRAAALYDVQEALSGVTAPTALIWGEQDPVLPPSSATRLDVLLANAPTEVFLLDDCGHIAMIEQREAVAGIIRHWLQENAA